MVIRKRSENMEKIDGIIRYIDYGKIDFDITQIMKQKNISKNQLAKKTGLHHQVIERYMNGTITRFDSDVLARLCYILECSIEDIMVYIKSK